MPGPFLVDWSASRRLALRFSLVFILLLVVGTGLPLTSSAIQERPQSGAAPKPARPEFVPGEALVRYRSESAANRQAQTILSTNEGRQLSIQLERFDGADIVPGLRLAHMAGADTMSAIEALKKQPGVLYAEPNYILHLDVTPNDPRFLSGELYGLTKIGATAAWNTTTGSNSVVVGVIDEGIDKTHPDLQLNIWTNPAEVPANGIDDDGNGFVDDVNGYNFPGNTGTIPGEDHATHVAGTIGGVGNNGIGVVGVNWNVRLMSLRFINGGSGSTSDAIRACNYAKLMRDLWVSTGGTKGANLRILNNSYGGATSTQSFLDAINALNQSGILFVAAAGNTPDSPEPNNDLVPHYPSSYAAPNVVAVAATDSSDNLSTFSHYGANTVQLGAPGTGILSTTTNNTYSFFNGTSMASPHVAGTAALLLAVNPNLTVQQLKSLLISNGDPVGSLSGKTLTGRRLNAANSLNALAENDSTPPGTVTSFHLNSQNGRTLNAGWTASGDDGALGQASLYQLTFTDAITGKIIDLKSVLPTAPGSAQAVDVKIPYRHTNGTLTLHEFDNAGNEGTPASVNVAVSQVEGDPYLMSLGNPAALSAGGTPLALIADDGLRLNYSLPFAFPFFGQNFSTVNISTNGNLFFSTPPTRTNGDADDVPSSSVVLARYKMIAGIWDDLRTDRRSGDDVYVVTPDASRVIFRWQAVTYGAGTLATEFPVNFEIELGSNGSIVMRYGAGQSSPTNTYLFPVVGISGGEPETYFVTTHSSEQAVTDLTNAREVSFLSWMSSQSLTVASVNPRSDVNITVNPNDGSGLGNGTTQFTRIYGSGTTVSLTAPAVSSGNTFQKWQRDGVDWSMNQATSLTMDANYTMTALYGPLQLLTINTVGDAADASVGDGHCDSDGNLGNGDQCTLRAAIQETNANPIDEGITFAASLNGSVITLNTALPDINGNLNILGPGASLLTIQRNPAGGTPNFRIFKINSGKMVSISALTISNGSLTGGDSGGGILVDGGILTLTNSTVSGNISANGAGLFNNAGTLTVMNSMISGNHANNGAGGGITNNSGVLNLSNSTLSANTCDARGGGLVNANFNGSGSIANVTNTTFSGNSSTGILTAGVGGIENLAGNNTLNLINCTVSGNTGMSNGGQAVGGIENNSGNSSANLRDTIVANNTSSAFADLNGTFNSQSHNLIGISSGSNGFTNGVNGDQVGTFAAPLDPRLGPLAANGGPTFTHALLFGSPAIDAGNSLLTIDQRGQPRPIDDQTVTNAPGGNGSDIGAYEAHSFQVNSTADSNDGSCTAVGTGNGCTLREAINAANPEVGVKLINFAPALTAGGPANISLGNALPTLTSDISLAGPGANLLTVRRSTAAGTPSFSVFLISGGNITISGLTISNGNAAGVFNNQGTLTVNSCTISGNQGSGIMNGQTTDGTLMLNDSVVSNNTAAGVWNRAQLGTTVTATINRSTISGNAGTGIFNSDDNGGAATLTLNNSTLSGNDYSGLLSRAAITGTATVTINNSTISGNNPNAGEIDAGGVTAWSLENAATSIVRINSSTISGNNAGSIGDGSGGLSSLSLNNGISTLSLYNTIVAGNFHNTATTVSDISGAIDPASSFNLIGDGTGMSGVSHGSNGNKVGSAGAPINPLLAQLANNGGPTQTRALLPGSPALDAGDNTSATNAQLTTDQRGSGFFRIRDAADANTTQTVDIGAFEADPSVEDITDKNSPEDSPLSFSFNVGDAATAFDSVTATSSNTTLLPNAPANLNLTGSGSTRTLNITPAANASGTTTITVTATKTISSVTVSMSDTFVLTVMPVADTPSVTNATTNEDVQTSSGLVITRNAADSTEVTHFKISVITNGTLFKHDGITPINNGDFITFAEGNAGLRFTPAPDVFGQGTFNIQASLGNTDAGLGGGSATATITVNAAADTPGVTNATTFINTQTTSGLVITRNPIDGAEVTHFKIGNILNGTLFKNDGTTQIANNAFITVAEGNAGLKFTPGTNLFSPATTFSFEARGATSGTGAGLSGPATASITVNCGGGASSIVTNTKDSGAGSLRDAVQKACPGNTITFDIPTSDPGFSGGVYTITLTSGELTLDRNLTISGLGSNLLTVQRSPAGGTSSFRIFKINSGNTVIMSGLTITNGRTPDGVNGTGGFGGGPGVEGGGILNSGTLTLTNVKVIANRTGTGGSSDNPSGFGGPGGFGGGIFNTGTLSVANSTVGSNQTGSGGISFTSGNGGNAGGILNSGTLNLTNSTISGNQTGSGINGFGGFGGNGGGILNTGTATLTNCTISNNQTGTGGDANGFGGPAGSGGFGGGIINYGIVTVTNSTVSSNQTGVGGNGGNGGPGGGIYNVNTTNISNSIVANNTVASGGLGPDLNGTFNSQDYNLIKNTAGATITGTTAHNITGQDPKLAALADNGGPTQTLLPLPGSPAIDAGDVSNLPPDTFDLDSDGNTSEPLPIDQRGFTRVVNTNFDIGAVETNYTIAATAGTPQSAVIHGAFATQLQAIVKESSVVQSGVSVTFTAPASGASGTFAGGGATATVMTDSTGVATAPLFTANGTAGGPYNVVAGTVTGLPTATFSLTNNQAATSTAVSSSLNPAPVGFTVTYTATVTSGAGIPTGTVVFKIDGANATSPRPLNASGVANLTISILIAGTHAITAEYSGDANFLGSVGTLAGGQLLIPSLTINDVSVTEGDSGTRTANFTVTLSAPSNLQVNVDFATANGSAIAGSDYQPASGTLTFNPDQRTQPISVTINGDTSFEANETFLVNLSNPVNAIINDAQGVGTILNDDVQGGFISFSQSNYNVGESGGSVTITVHRSNNLSNPVTVDYATTEASGPSSPPCSAINGFASSRCDYTSALGTLRFAAGESSKTFLVLISQDNYVEGPESLTLTLSNLSGGAVFATPSTATLTIADDPSEPPNNPINDAEVFVRQHYHDFLNREPDAGGLGFWANQITECDNVPLPPGFTDAQQCREIRRINVSAAFFLSIEFQETGYLVERLYKSSYGDALGTSNFGPPHQLPVPVVRFSEFLPDTQQIGKDVVVGQTGWEQQLENNKVAFTQDFVLRSRFTTAYATTMPPTQFVDALYVNAGVTPSAAERSSVIGEFGGAGNSADTVARARALRRVAENSMLNQQESNKAFVLMQYFGYLRRNPNDLPDSDYSGYDFWLTKLNQFNGNFQNAEMVKAFIISGEYRQRFGP